VSGVPLVRVRRLGHDFGSVQALRDVSFDLEPGEVLGICGPAGAGKTTLLRALATLIDPTSGHVEIAGIDAALEPERVRQRVGYLSAHSGSYVELTVEEYLTFFAAAHRADLRSSVERSIAFCGLSDCRRELTAALSRPLRRQVLFARTLLHDPQVLLLDEALTDLDAAAQAMTKTLLIALAEAGKAVVVSSRAPADVMGLGGSMASLKTGTFTREQAPASPSRPPTIAPAHAGGRAIAGQTAPSAVLRCSVRVIGSLETAARLAGEFAFVRRVETSSHGIVVDLVGGEAAIAEIVRKLVQAGFGVTGVSSSPMPVAVVAS
jgi:ABC-type multidrug transport system ATPase subunit